MEKNIKDLRELIAERLKEVENLQQELNRMEQERIDRFRSLYNELVEDGVDPMEILGLNKSKQATVTTTENTVVEDETQESTCVEVCGSLEPTTEHDNIVGDTEIIGEIEEVSSSNLSPHKTRKGNRPFKGEYRQLLSPFYDMLRDDYIDTDVYVNTRLLLPSYSFFDEEPIGEIIQIGNLKYKDIWKDAQETRIIHQDGVCPCLTTVAVPYVFINGHDDEDDKEVFPLAKIG